MARIDPTSPSLSGSLATHVSVAVRAENPASAAWMQRDELLDLCAEYVRRRMAVRPDSAGSAATLPLVEIVEGYLHGEISESEKNSLISYVRGVDADDDGDDPLMGDWAEATLAELDDPVG